LQPGCAEVTHHGQAFGKQRWEAVTRQALDASVGPHAQQILDERQRTREQRHARSSPFDVQHPGGRTPEDRRAQPMMTVVTRVTLREGTEPQWDAAMKQRLEQVKSQPGWVGGQLVIPVDGLNSRVIIGTWETRADWEAWHADPKFQETRKKLQGLESKASEEWWHEVVADLRRAA